MKLDENETPVTIWERVLSSIAAILVRRNGGEGSQEQSSHLMVIMMPLYLNLRGHANHIQSNALAFHSSSMHKLTSVVASVPVLVLSNSLNVYVRSVIP